MKEEDFFADMPTDDIEFLPLISVDDEEGDSNKRKIDTTSINILPLKNTVLFPGVVIPITVGRKRSIKAVQSAYRGNRTIGVISQKDIKIEDPKAKDLNSIGTVARIIKQLKMPNGNTTVIIQGKKRFKIKEFISESPFIKASIDMLDETIPSDKDKEFVATMASIKELAAKIITLSPNIPSEASVILKNVESASFLVSFIASNLNIELKEKQSIIETQDLKERAQKVLQHMHNELQMLELKNKIQDKVQTDLEEQQKEYFLHQQLKTIQEELGGDSVNQEIKNLEKKAKTKKWGKEAKEMFERELGKLQRINPAAAEYSVVHNYLELLLDLPWGEYTKDKFDLKNAQKVLDKDHFGLEKIKERILEYLAVLKLKGDMKSPILCLVGPPGVGKTSLGKSIANALKRKYVRMALGGLHDEAEIRGHRKTYIGAMPGRVVQSLKKAKSSNPVFILDEIDKVGADHRGDPSSALLEVLDPEQNQAFYDNYLELEYDLSKVMFIATANSLNSIQPALRDRMEIIHVSGYSLEEKIEIANKHLISKQRTTHGLKATDIKVNKTIIKKVIEDYTRESGVRELDRQIASIMRSVAKRVAMEEKYNKTIQQDDLYTYLGPTKYEKDIFKKQNQPGIAVGLAWTAVGGDILYIESILSEGKGKLTLTGSLGDVMKESAATALSLVKANAKKLDINIEDFQKKDIHIHVPDGATPKDGPSAGITMLTAIASVYSGKKVKPFLGMTGEISLRGEVLPVGGIKEKILAAKRAGLKELIMCKANEKDVLEVKEDYIKGLKFHYVKHMNEVLDIALG